MAGAGSSRSTYFKEALRIFFVVAAYWLVSILLVFINKRVLNSKEFQAPVFVTWIQCVVTVFCLFIVYLTYKGLQLTGFSHFFSPLLVHLKALDLTTIFVGMILFNNYTLKLMPVSFYNIARALSTVFNMVFTRIILRECISFRATICCLVVIGGFSLGIFEENSLKGSLPYLPVVMGVLSSIFVSLFAIYTKLSLFLVSNNVWQLQVVNSINAIFLFLPLIALLGDSGTVYYLGQNSSLFSMLWLEIIITGIFGFMVGVCTSLQIKYTSPLTHNISGTAKSCAQTVLAVIIYRETDRGFLWWLSNALVLLGSAAYSYVRSIEMRDKAKTDYQLPSPYNTCKFR